MPRPDKARIIETARPRSTTQKETLATSVYEQLRMDLVAGRIEPNSKVRVDWVVATYGAGTSPVREALSRLAAEGLLDRRDQRGFSVVPVSDADLDELTRTRCWLEAIALREAILHRTTEWEEALVLDLHRLGRTSRILVDDIGLTNPEWERLHRNFHRTLISRCRSRWLIGFCEQLADQAFRYREIARSRSNRTRDAAAEHRVIAEHAIAGKTDDAVEALISHYTLTSELCRVGLDEKHGDASYEAPGGEAVSASRAKSKLRIR